MFPNADRVVEKWMAQRVAYRYMVARTYKEYVQEKKRKSEKPLGRKEWEARGKKDEGAPKGKGGFRGKIKSLLKAIPDVSKKMAQALSEAPAKTQQFFVDKEYRNKATREIAGALKKGGTKAAKAIYNNAKKELKSFPKAAKIAVSLAKEKRLPTKEEAKTLYGVGVYVFGTALGGVAGGMAGTSAANAIAGAAYGGSKALIHSIGLHIGIGAAHGGADDAFLHGETAESVGTLTGHAQQLGWGSGDIPGAGHVMDTAVEGAKWLGKMLLASDHTHVAAEEDDGDAMQKFMTAIYDNVIKQLEKGLTDDDMVAILQRG